MTADTIEEALIELDAALENECRSSLENRDELLAELATLRAHSAALRTIAEKHEEWWLRAVDHGTSDDCAGCGAPVGGRSLYAEGQPGVWVLECTHAPDCWAAPIVEMMEGMGET